MRRNYTLRFYDFANAGRTTPAAVQDTLTNPAPGVPPITATVHEVQTDGADLIAVVELDPKDWIKQQTALDIDLHDILTELQPQLTLAELTELIHWIVNDDTITHAWLNTNHGELTVDN